MKPAFNNVVIVIGGDHHNTLAVVRCLGLKKCPFEVLVHTEKGSHAKVSNSKFAKGRISLITPDEQDLLAWLRDKAAGQNLGKMVLLPCSDWAAFMIDKYSQELLPNYVIPGFAEKPGRVACLMDKMQQKLLADQYSIPMAESWSVQVVPLPILPEGLDFPCIIKPEVSAHGRKADIVVCQTKEEYSAAMDRLLVLGYDQVIVQRYLRKKFEICAFGAMLPNKNYDGVIVKKIRETAPPAQGSTLLAEFINDSQINNAVESVLQMLANEGYHGMYDIEMLVCETGIYLNEINFRSSGCGFGMIKGKRALAYQWVEGEIMPNRIIQLEKPTKEIIQNDLGDLFGRRSNHISLKTWLIDFVCSSSHAFFCCKDISGTVAYYRRLFHRR